MAPPEEDGENSASQKVTKKCEFCNNGFRSYVKCINCNFIIHSKCFETASKLFNINSKANWKCKQCNQEPDGVVAETTESQEENINKCDPKQSFEQMKRELNLLYKLNSELDTTNKLLKLRLNDKDEDFRNIFESGKLPSKVNTPSTSSNIDQMEPRAQISFRDKLVGAKNGNSAVLIIEPKNSNIDLNTFKTNVNPADLGPGINTIKQTNSGKMVINCTTSEYLQSVKSNLEKTAGENFKVTIPNKFNPRIQILNAEHTDTTNEQLSNDIIKENQFNILNDVHLKVVKKYIKKYKMDIIVEVSPALFKKIINDGFVFVGWRKCFVTESFHITRCFKCSGFGHLSKNCKSSVYNCPNCSESHKLEECNEKINFTCINCVNYNKHFKTNLDTNHSAKDNHCAIYKNQIVYLQSKINYEV